MLVRYSCFRFHIIFLIGIVDSNLVCNVDQNIRKNVYLVAM